MSRVAVSGSSASASHERRPPLRHPGHGAAGRHAGRAASGSRTTLVVIAASLFLASVALTVMQSLDMSAMNGMPMPGDWTMSMTWMRMPGQSWLGAAASFLGMWTVMMVAMMLPSVTPILWRLHVAIATAGSARPGRLVALASVGYFTAWAVLGMIVYPLGVAFAALAMVQPAVALAVPLVSGLVVVFAGTLQLTAWKVRQLACCGTKLPDARATPVDPGAALRYGLRVGRHCIHCCASLTAVLLVVGVMDLGAMAVVTAAITLERVASVAAARVTGVVAIAAGMLSIAQALGAG